MDQYQQNCVKVKIKFEERAKYGKYFRTETKSAELCENEIKFVRIYILYHRAKFEIM